MIDVLLGQKQWVTSGGVLIVERGELELHQQRSRRGPDGTFETADRTSIEVGEVGLTERGPGNQVIVYSPLLNASSQLCSERRWTGIEPAGRGSPVPTALKAAEPTRCPDTSLAANGSSTR